MNNGPESMESIFVGIGAGGIFPVSVGGSCDWLLCCSVVFVLLFLMVLGVVVVGRKIVTLCISLVVTNIIRGDDRVWREQGFIQRWRSNHGNFGDSGSRIISLRLSGGKGDVGAICANSLGLVQVSLGEGISS